ncbi:head-tail connector protein [Achromobacter ruhlandii]|uniref:head-tail connector protein n=1 Tax=Achromobacter ruhlandii TaxID=72557 RepID=UPI003B992439
MELIGLSLVKRHLRVRTAVDDELISFYLAAAQEMAEAYLGAKLCVTEEERSQLVNAGGRPDAAIVATADIKLALLLTVGSAFENREDEVIGQAAVKLTRSAESLLWPHRVDLGV